jgi:hypothetical protein
VRRFKVSSDGTRRLISVHNRSSPTRAKPDLEESSCVVEPFYVPVNSRMKNRDSKNFWDDGIDDQPFKPLGSTLAASAP